MSVAFEINFHCGFKLFIHFTKQLFRRKIRERISLQHAAIWLIEVWLTKHSKTATWFPQTQNDSRRKITTNQNEPHAWKLMTISSQILRCVSLICLFSSIVQAKNHFMIHIIMHTIGLCVGKISFLNCVCVCRRRCVGLQNVYTSFVFWNEV